MGQVLWTHAFLEEQDHKVIKNIIYQDNKSVILLAENGRGAASKKTRHMEIRYFFLKDCIASGEVTIEHFPTKSMLADFFTKPLQCGLFKEFRDLILNTNVSCCPKDRQDSRSVLVKLQDKARNADDCEPHKVVTFKSPTGTGAVRYGVTKGKPLSYPKTKYPGKKYPGTDNNIIKTVMGSGLRKAKTADKSEK